MTGKHKQTQEPISDELIEKIIAAQKYRRASMYIRQLAIGAVDFELHHFYDAKNQTITDAQGERSMPINDYMQWRFREITHHAYGEWFKFLNRFGHAFGEGGEYASAYNTYIVSMIMAAVYGKPFEDAFGNPERMLELGRRMVTDGLYGLGGSRDQIEMLSAFTGIPFSFDDANALESFFEFVGV